MAVSASRPSHPTASASRATCRLRAGVTPDSPSYKWSVAGTMMLNVLAVLLNIAATSMALPASMTTLSMSLDEVQWVITAYMIASAVVTPTVGWLGNVLGNRNLLLFSVALFVIGSVRCGLAVGLFALGGRAVWASARCSAAISPNTCTGAWFSASISSMGWSASC